LPGYGREHFIKGKTIKEIARDLKGVAEHGPEGAEVRRDLIRVRGVSSSRGRSWDGGRQKLDGLLSGNAGKSAREQLTLIRIFEELRGRGYDGGLRRPCDVTPGDGARERGQSTAAAYVPLSFAPGESLSV